MSLFWPAVEVLKKVLSMQLFDCFFSLLPRDVFPSHGLVETRARGQALADIAEKKVGHSKRPGVVSAQRVVERTMGGTWREVASFRSLHELLRAMKGSGRKGRGGLHIAPGEQLLQ